MKGVFLLLALLAFPATAEKMVPQGIIPVPEEPDIAVTLGVDKDSYAPGDLLTLRFTLSQDAYVYLYDVTPDGEVKLLVPNRFLQEPVFPAGQHVLPTEGWRLKVTEPEGVEYLALLATCQPLSFYDAKAFEEAPFLTFTDPPAFARKLQALLVGNWGAAWTSFRVHRPRATVHLASDPSGAAVWSEGDLLGRTPLTATVPAGKVELLLTFPGYEDESFPLELTDGDELALFVTLERSPSLPHTGEAQPPIVSPGGSFGWGSLGLELWGGNLGVGLAIRPGAIPTSPTEPGLGGWFARGPELELYLIGWGKSAESPFGAAAILGLALQERAWLPGWSPTGVLHPLVEVEPETELSLQPTFGAGFGIEGKFLRVYLAWHIRRGVIIGFITRGY